MEVAEPGSQPRIFISKASFLCDAMLVPAERSGWSQVCKSTAGWALAQPLPRSLSCARKTAASRINKYCAIYMDIFVLGGKRQIILRVEKGAEDPEALIVRILVTSLWLQISRKPSI